MLIGRRHKANKSQQPRYSTSAASRADCAGNAADTSAASYKEGIADRRKSRKDKPHKDKSRKDKSHKRKPHKDKSHKNKLRKNKPHKDKSRRPHRLAVLLRLRRRGDRSDPWIRFRAGFALLTTVIIVGTAGFIVLGLNPYDALFQTVITISTVGYSEARVTDSSSHLYQGFTLVLILLGTSSALYTLGVLMDTLFEGRLNDRFRRLQMRETIKQMRGHTIVCGYGQVGRAIAADLVEEDCDVVVIDHDELVNDDTQLIINAEATDDQTLIDAGVERASTLVLAFNSDVANLYVTLSARAMRDDLFIVARTNSPSTVSKLERAGADRVINPNEIGAARMASVARHPGVVTYFDELIPSSGNEVRVKEYRIPPESDLVRMQLGASAVGSGWGGVVLAIGRDGEWLRAPRDDFVLSAADMLVLLGTHEQLAVVFDGFE